MPNPFRYRPETTDQDDDVDEWADNPLSNLMAWYSQTFIKPWCGPGDHWTLKVSDYLFTSCPCCMVFRGLTLGFIGGIWLAIIVAALLKIFF